MISRPRVPVSVEIPIVGRKSEIQVNHCRMPDCDNYGIPAITTRIKPGPSPGRDMHYKVATTNKGRVSALVCKCCGEKPPIKSNLGIAEELARISEPLLDSDRGCPRKDCENHGKNTQAHPNRYHKRGLDNHTRRPVRGCKACGGRFSHRYGSPANSSAAPPFGVIRLQPSSEQSTGTPNPARHRQVRQAPTVL